MSEDQKIELWSRVYAAAISAGGSPPNAIATANTSVYTAEERFGAQPNVTSRNSE